MDSDTSHVARVKGERVVKVPSSLVERAEENKRRELSVPWLRSVVFQPAYLEHIRTTIQSNQVQ